MLPLFLMVIMVVMMMVVSVCVSFKISEASCFELIFDCLAIASRRRIGVYWRREGEKSNSVSEGGPPILLFWAHTSCHFHYHLPDYLPACLHYTTLIMLMPPPPRVFVVAVRHILGLGLWKGSGKGVDKLMYAVILLLLRNSCVY